MPSEKDIVVEARELLADLPEVADAAYNIEHALFADAVERERRSPFWGHSKQLARVYARTPELLRALADEVERLREQWNTRFNTLCGNCGKRYLGPRDEHLHGFGICNVTKPED